MLDYVIIIFYKYTHNDNYKHNNHDRPDIAAAHHGGLPTAQSPGRPRGAASGPRGRSGPLPPA